MREQLVESALLAFLGTVAAFVVARLVILRLLSGAIRLVPEVSIDIAPEINASVAAVALTSAGVALVVCGVVPAIHGSRGRLKDALASDGQNAPMPRWRGRRGLIACQVAVSAGLVAVAALCAQQLIGLERHDSGMDIDHLAMVQVNAQTSGRDEVQARRAFERILDAARRLPGVQSAALSSGFPLELGARGGAVATSPEELTPGFYDFMISSPDVFDTWGVRIRQGRGFTDGDTASSELVVILTERLAKRLFPNSAPVGQHIVLQWRRMPGEPPSPIQTVTVVGIASDTDVGTPGNRGGGYLYVPWTQHSNPAMIVTVRTTVDPSALVDPLKRLVNQVDPELPVVFAEPASQLAAARNVVLRVGAAAGGLLGWLTFVLAMAGLYGVLSELVLRRTRELGIRMALGADSRLLLRMVLIDGVRPVLAGIAIGSGIGAILRLAFRPLFIRILPAFDPLVITSVAFAFVLAALLAAYLPARRASHVDPNVALRHL
jgi:predicted permease